MTGSVPVVGRSDVLRYRSWRQELDREPGHHIRIAVRRPARPEMRPAGATLGQPCGAA